MTKYFILFFIFVLATNNFAQTVNNPEKKKPVTNSNGQEGSQNSKKINSCFTIKPDSLKGWFKINCSCNSSTVEIFNSKGEKVYSSESFVGHLKIDLSLQPKGAYTARINGGDHCCNNEKTFHIK